MKKIFMKKIYHDDVSPSNVSPNKKFWMFRPSDNASLEQCGLDIASLRPSVPNRGVLTQDCIEVPVKISGHNPK